MPSITVSQHTHERMAKASLSGTIDARTTTFNPDGTVTFQVEAAVKARLDEISPDPELAIIKALDVYFKARLSR